MKYDVFSGFNEETQTWIYEDGSQAVEKNMKLAGTPWNETFWINRQITSKDSKSNCMSFRSAGMKDLSSWGYELNECSSKKQFLCKRKPLGRLNIIFIIFRLIFFYLSWCSLL